jgi:hypothetical protein
MDKQAIKRRGFFLQKTVGREPLVGKEVTTKEDRPIELLSSD